jgi:hypothetical protein
MHLCQLVHLSCVARPPAELYLISAVVKDEALAAVERLGKLCTLDAFRDVLADGALGQCARPLHAIIARPKFGTALKHPVTVCLPNMASGI